MIKKSVIGIMGLIVVVSSLVVLTEILNRPVNAQINYKRSRPKCPAGVCPNPLAPLFESQEEPREIIEEQVPMQSQTLQRSTMGRDRCGLICRIRQNRQARVQSRRSRRGR